MKRQSKFQNLHFKQLQPYRITIIVIWCMYFVIILHKSSITLFIKILPHQLQYPEACFLNIGPWKSLLWPSGPEQYPQNGSCWGQIMESYFEWTIIWGYCSSSSDLAPYRNSSSTRWSFTWKKFILRMLLKAKRIQWKFSSTYLRRA